jgi:hypothetical protein
VGKEGNLFFIIILYKLKLLNIKLIKFFFLINCIQFIKKKNLINFIFNNFNLFDDGKQLIHKLGKLNKISNVLKYLYT